jgi:predicted permease
MLTNPCLIAVVVGIFLMILQIQLPVFLELAIGKLNAATTPLALLFLGMLIHRYGLFAWKADKTAIVYAVGKVIVLPVCVTLVLQFFMPFSTAACIGFLFGSPAPLASVVWSKQYGKDDQFAVNCCISSTFLFIPVMSILLLVLSNLGVV